MKKATISRLAGLLPASAGNWAVALSYFGYSSDKEYRIVLDGAHTYYQWGRRDARGELRHIEHPDPATARAAALSQWASKEARGYWPSTGLLENLTSDDFLANPVRSINQAYREAVRTLNSSVQAGDSVWLVQRVLARGRVPTIPALESCLVAGSMHDDRLAVSIHPDCERALVAVYPIAVHVSAPGRTAALVAEMADSFVADTGGATERESFEQAIALATACLA